MTPKPPDSPRPALRSIATEAWRELFPLALLFVLLPVAYVYQTRAWSHIQHLKSVIFLGVIASLAFVSRRGLSRLLGTPRNPYSAMVLCGCLLLAIWVGWNEWFWSHLMSSGYGTGIFAKVYQNGHSPVYGRPEDPTHPVLLLVATLVVTWLCFNATRGRSPARLAMSLALAQAAMICAFALTDGPTRLLSTFDALVPFKQDARKFGSVYELLHTYTARQPDLTFRGAHYPPGLVLLFFLELRLGLPSAVKVLVIVSACAAAALIPSLAREFDDRPLVPFLAGAFYVTSANTILFPTTAESPLEMPLVVGGIWALIRAMRRDGLKYPALLGLVAAALAFLNFVVVTVAMSWAVLVGLISWSERPPIQRLVRLAVVSLGAFGAVYATIFALTGFNLPDHLLRSVRQNEAGMSTESTFVFVRWFLRATANVLAYLLSLGFPIVTFVATLLWRARAVGEKSWVLGATFFAGLILAALSGVYYLETERIWIFFTPFAVIAAASALESIASFEASRAPFFVLAATAIFAALQELYYKHYFGTEG
ncbi:MAG: hypothetical protein HYV07_28795 [Deltaproteobacteria bacterium]|nr:hypothetical protein [Deltaproteobacteria bacterium]